MSHSPNKSRKAGWYVTDGRSYKVSMPEHGPAGPSLKVKRMVGVDVEHVRLADTRKCGDKAFMVVATTSKFNGMEMILSSAPEFWARYEQLTAHTEARKQEMERCLLFLLEAGQLPEEQVQRWRDDPQTRFYEEHDKGFGKFVPAVGYLRLKLDFDPERDREAEEKHYAYAYHGTKLSNLASIVKHGFVRPGKRTPEGKEVKIRPGHIPGENYVFTSKSHHYASHYIYASPSRWRAHDGRVYWGIIVLQVRQDRNKVIEQGNTIGRSLWPRDAPFDEHVPNDEIEWKTVAQKSIVPYGVLVRLFEEPPVVGWARRLLGMGHTLDPRVQEMVDDWEKRGLESAAASFCCEDDTFGMLEAGVLRRALTSAVRVEDDASPSASSTGSEDTVARSSEPASASSPRAMPVGGMYLAGGAGRLSPPSRRRGRAYTLPSAAKKMTPTPSRPSRKAASPPKTPSSSSPATTTSTPSSTHAAPKATASPATLSSSPPSSVELLVPIATRSGSIITHVTRAKPELGVSFSLQQAVSRMREAGHELQLEFFDDAAYRAYPHGDTSAMLDAFVSLDDPNTQVAQPSRPQYEVNFAAGAQINTKTGMSRPVRISLVAKQSTPDMRCTSAPFSEWRLDDTGAGSWMPMADEADVAAFEGRFRQAMVVSRPSNDAQILAFPASGAALLRTGTGVHVAHVQRMSVVAEDLFAAALVPSMLPDFAIIRFQFSPRVDGAIGTPRTIGDQRQWTDLSPTDSATLLKACISRTEEVVLASGLHISPRFGTAEDAAGTPLQLRVVALNAFTSWEWCEGRRWTSYDAEIQDLLNDAAVQRFVVQLQSGAKYELDKANMTQTNLTTGFTRPIRRVVVITPVGRT